MTNTLYVVPSDFILAMGSNILLSKKSLARVKSVKYEIEECLAEK